MYSDGKTEVPYVTTKEGFGVDFGGFFEVGVASAPKGGKISFFDLKDAGGENNVSTGPFGYTYSTDRGKTGYGAKENSYKYQDRSFSLQFGPIPFGATGYSTKTRIGTPRKIDYSRMNPIGEK